MNSILMQVVLDVAGFLMLGGEDVINPDAAAEQLEVMCAGLRRLSDQERAEFRRYLEGVVKAEEEQLNRPEILSFVGSFEYLCLRGEPE